MLRVYLSIFALACASSLGYAKETPSSGPGVKVDATAPDFELANQKGEKLKLSTMLKKGPVAIVFHRSAGW